VQVGGFAALVTQAAAEGDGVAADIVARAVREALLLAGVVVRRAWGEDAWPEHHRPEHPAPEHARPEDPRPAPPAILAGGLFSDPLFRAGVERGLRARGFVPSLLAHRPVDGLVAALVTAATATAAEAPTRDPNP
jgi:hypothetical protein